MSKKKNVTEASKSEATTIEATAPVTITVKPEQVVNGTDGDAKKPGRPVDPNSPRQIKLAADAAAREAGLLKRGRKPIEGSDRQKRLAELAIKREQGLLTGERGRPAVPGSTNQMKKAAMQAKMEAGEDIKPGRPKYTAEQKAEAEKIKAAKKAEAKAKNLATIAEAKAKKAAAAVTPAVEA